VLVTTFDDITISWPQFTMTLSPQMISQQRKQIGSVPMNCLAISAIRISLALVFGMIVCGSGCSKKPSAAAPPAPEVQAQAAPEATAPAPPNPSRAQQVGQVVQADGQADMGELNRCLLRWMMGNKRPPANFEDFAATAGVTIPPPPPGKKYRIGKDMHVVLVDR